MTALRTLLPLAALLVTPALVACEKPQPGDDSGDTTGDADTDTDTDTEGESSTGGPDGQVPENMACSADVFGTSRACEGGLQYCASDGASPVASYFWGPCLAAPACEPGAAEGCLECELGPDGVPAWVDGCEEEEEGTSTPLVLRYGDEPVRYASSSATFDLGPQCGATDWPSAATPWLALDRDGSGGIDGGHELFGSATVLAGGGLADNGFVALAELDRDRDGRISASDPEFARLLVWADHDADRRSTAWELTPATVAGLVSIDLTYRKDALCDARHNCEIERAAFLYRDVAGTTRTGEVVDIHLACQ